MFTLKRYLIENDDDIFLHISLDTEPRGSSSGLDRYFRGEIIIEKSWIGHVNRKRNEFRITRTKLGLLKTGISMIEICGQLTKDQKKIEITLRPTWLTIVNVIAGLLLPGFIVINFFNDVVGWTVFTGLITILILLLILDLRKTEEKFIDYLNQIKIG